MNSSAALLSLPLILPLFGALLTFFFQRQRILWGRLLLLSHLLASLWLATEVVRQGTLATAVGDWLAPYGIVLIADPFAALLLSVSSLIFFCCLFMYEEHGYRGFYPLLFLLQTAVSLSFLSGDFFNLFVAFELMLLSSYAIMTLTADPQKLINVYSYISMNVMASFLYLVSVAIFYGYTGSLNFGALAVLFEKREGVLPLIPVLAIGLSLCIKSGIFPLYYWLPDSYPLLPSHLAALFGGILTKVGIYAFFRIFLTLFSFPHPEIDRLLLVLACLTMFFGVVGAVSRNSIKGILSYHIISQIGYMLFALTLATPFGIAAGIFFIVHNMIVKSSLFLVGNIAEIKCQSGRLTSMGGLWSEAPFLGVLFLLQSFSLAGLPPLSGFWGKYLLFFQGLKQEQFVAVFVALITSFFTLYSMVKVWNSAFLGNEKQQLLPVTKSVYVGPILLTLSALLMAVFPQKFFELSQLAAEKLVDHGDYVSKSLESGSKGTHSHFVGRTFSREKCVRFCILRRTNGGNSICKEQNAKDGRFLPEKGHPQNGNAASKGRS